MHPPEIHDKFIGVLVAALRRLGEALGYHMLQFQRYAAAEPGDRLGFGIQYGIELRILVFRIKRPPAREHFIEKYP